MNSRTKLFSNLVSLFCLLSNYNCIAQSGCVDPQAINYNAAATINDGSCIYNATNYTCPVVDTLNALFNEISGMVYWNNKIYVHNDGGNSTNLYELDTLGSLTKTIQLPSISNTDWEDFTQDATHFYIADVGNNSGNRTDLKIYKFPKSSITSGSMVTIADSLIETIAFAYPDQTDFTSAYNNNKFDCEAVAFKNGLLHLFTKNWVNSLCMHYTIPSVAGTYVATKIDSLAGQGVLITGADIIADELMLVGYQVNGIYEAAMWYVFDFDSTQNNFFVNGNKRKIVFGSAASVGQVESICFKNNSKQGYISNEFFSPLSQLIIKPTLYKFTTSNWYPYTYLPNGISNIASNNAQISINKNSAKIISNNLQNANCQIINTTGSIVYNNKLALQQGQNIITLPPLAQGIYIFKLWGGTTYANMKFVQD